MIGMTPAPGQEPMVDEKKEKPAMDAKKEKAPAKKAKAGDDKPKAEKPVAKKKAELKEYEQYYKLVGGQCRRYNDEGEYEVVSMGYCR